MTRQNTIPRVLLAGLFVLTMAATTAAKDDPYQQADNTWISISGTISSVAPDAFVLDYGESTITVEMDDGDRDADAYKLLEGDKVTVNGMVDDDLFETTTIEASSVYVQKLDTYFYASAVDEEDRWVAVVDPVVVARTILQGTVTGVDDEEFTLASGGRMITVEVDEMSYNPLDDTGYQRIEVGDRVSVTGEMDYDFLEGREFVADSIVTLSD